MLDMLSSAQFWVDVLKIIVIDLLLSGDNAVVIALACRNLPPEQRSKGVLFGVFGAIGLRIVLTFFAVGLLSLPYLKLAGALLLIWIGIRLILPESEKHGTSNIGGDDQLWGAVKTIIVADFVMSLDNVLGVAGAAHGNVWLLIFGLLVSIPLIAWSSQLVLRLIDRFPLIIYAGGALLGYVAGEMLVTDSYIVTMLAGKTATAHWLVPAACALLVVVIGLWFTMRGAKGRPASMLDEQIPSSGDKHV
jgi:YjbE family integral membrane protein